MSKNRVDINEISIDIALQKNETSSLAENLVKVNQGMSKNKATMKEISEGRVLEQKRISYSITKTELFKLTFQGGKRVAGSRGPAKLPVNVIILMNCYRLNANID